MQRPLLPSFPSLLLSLLSPLHFLSLTFLFFFQFYFRLFFSSTLLSLPLLFSLCLFLTPSSSIISFYLLSLSLLSLIFLDFLFHFFSFLIFFYFQTFLTSLFIFHSLFPPDHSYAFFFLFFHFL